MRGASYTSILPNVLPLPNFLHAIIIYKGSQNITRFEEFALICTILEHTQLWSPKYSHVRSKYIYSTHQLIPWGRVAYDVLILGTILIPHFRTMFYWIQSSTEGNNPSEIELRLKSNQVQTFIFLKCNNRFR